MDQRPLFVDNARKMTPYFQGIAIDAARMSAALDLYKRVDAGR